MYMVVDCCLAAMSWSTVLINKPPIFSLQISMSVMMLHVEAMPIVPIQKGPMSALAMKAIVEILTLVVWVIET